MRLKLYLKNPFRLYTVFSSKGWCNWIPDRLHIKLEFRAHLGKWPNLDDPKSYSEKIQWLKLYHRKPEYTKIVDKVQVRDYIAEKIGEEYLIPLLGVWDDPDEIDFDKLPDRFVLKCNHTSGGVVVCKDKSTFDIEEAKKKLRKTLKLDYYRISREWPYKNVPRKILAEEYLEGDETGLSDYKLLCYNGKHRLTMVTSHRTATGHRATCYDKDWNMMPFEWPDRFPAVKEGHPKPLNLDKMSELADILAAGEPQMRVDFYNLNGKIYFGELTLYSAAGFERMEPEEWDYIQGSWIDLPKEKTLGD